MQVVNLTKGTILADRADVADSFSRRLVGLIRHRRWYLEAGRGLVIRPCNGIHTLFMRFPLDVAFLDREGRVISQIAELFPYRFSPVVARAAAAVELPAGMLALSRTEVGDQIVSLM
ncbi:MAG: DUF192 domain-containing protein [Syntrophothermus sp.]